MAKKNKKTDAEAATEVQASGPEAITLRTHPRAMTSIRRTRARAGLIAFALVLVLCLHAHVPPADAAARALAAGVAIQLLAWRIAVAFWRQLVLAQVNAARVAHNERLRARAKALRAASAAVADAKL